MRTDFLEAAAEGLPSGKRTLVDRVRRGRRPGLAPLSGLRLSRAIVGWSA